MRSKCTEVLARGDGMGSVEHTAHAWGSAGLSGPHCSAHPNLARPWVSKNYEKLVNTFSFKACGASGSDSFVVFI